MSAWVRDSTGHLVSVESNETKMTDPILPMILMEMLPASIITPIMHQIAGSHREQLRVEAAIHNDASQILCARI